MAGIFSHIILIALSVALFTGCEGDLGDKLQSGRVLALQGLQGRWVGPVVPADRTCGQTAQGLMSISKNSFAFDPFQSTTVISGAVGKDDHLIGRLSRQGGDGQGLSITFEGAASASEAIEGTLMSGRCRWTVTLHRG